MADRAPRPLSELARAVYRAYEERDRERMEGLLAANFTFYAPPDPGIDREAYWEKCWPGGEAIERFEIVRLVEDGDEAIVTYEATRADGSRFRNTEVLGFEGEQMVKAEVYFGWDL